MARTPTGPYSLHRTGCYGCVRSSADDGSCGVHGYPCTHYGLDLFATSPDVFAPEAGVIVRVSDGQSAPFVGYNPGVILMQGASGYYHLLGHLNYSTIAVSPGQPVVEGQPLGQFSTAVGHTHWEVRIQPTGSSNTNTIDPNDWLADQLSQPASAAAAPAPASSNGSRVAVGLLLMAGFVGLSWLALRVAKHAATAV